MTLISRTKIEDMNVGDMIPCRYTATSGVAGYFSELGTCISAEIPITGTATPDGKFNFIKVDKGMLIADRVVQTAISWDTLNAIKYTYGFDMDKSLAISESINAANYGDVQVTSNIATGWHAFSKDYTYYTYPNDWVNGIITTYFPTGKKITNINVKNPTWSSYPGLGSFEFYGSYNNVDFVLLCGGSTPTIGSYDYIISNPQNYTYYKFACTSNNLYIYIKLRYYCKDPAFNKSMIRSLSGGNAYLGTDGKAGLTDKGLGAWPVNNEWDKYIVNSDLGGKITPGDDKVWHWGTASFSKDTPILNININTVVSTASNRMARGYLDVKRLNAPASGATFTTIGFRPVLEYPEDARCTNIWY
jgi:hypothetical protein